MAKGTNLPRYRSGWTTKDGERKLGFWQFRHKGRYVSLTKWGAPQGDGSKAALNRAVKARGKRPIQTGARVEDGPLSST